MTEAGETTKIRTGTARSATRRQSETTAIPCVCLPPPAPMRPQHAACHLQLRGPSCAEVLQLRCCGRGELTGRPPRCPQVGDDEYEDKIDKDEAKKDLGALEAAKMAIKFLDQVRCRSAAPLQLQLRLRLRSAAPAPRLRSAAPTPRLRLRGSGA